MKFLANPLTSLQLAIAKLILLGIVLAIGAFAFKHWLDERDTNAANANTAEQAQRTGAAVVDISNAAITAQDAKQMFDEGLRQQRVTVVLQQEKLKNENPDVSNYANNSIPYKLRFNACKARVAAKRFSNGKAWCEDAPSPPAD